jgi:hypothetical protein
VGRPGLAALASEEAENKTYEIATCGIAGENRIERRVCAKCCISENPAPKLDWWEVGQESTGCQNVIRADAIAPNSVKDDLLAGDDVCGRDGHAHVTAI